MVECTEIYQMLNNIDYKYESSNVASLDELRSVSDIYQSYLHYQLL